MRVLKIWILNNQNQIIKHAVENSVRMCLRAFTCKQFKCCGQRTSWLHPKYIRLSVLV
ncbi:hypothetical protein Hanom_Chr12g01082661 [Helianthus anomalus]